MLFDDAHRMVVGALIPFVKHDWGLSQPFGALTSVIYVTIAIFVLAVFRLIAAGLLLMGSRWYEMDLGRVEQIVLLDE